MWSLQNSKSYGSFLEIIARPYVDRGKQEAEGPAPEEGPAEEAAPTKPKKATGFFGRFIGAGSASEDEDEVQDLEPLPPAPSAETDGLPPTGSAALNKVCKLGWTFARPLRPLRALPLSEELLAGG